MWGMLGGIFSQVTPLPSFAQHLMSNCFSNMTDWECHAYSPSSTGIISMSSPNISLFLSIILLHPILSLERAQQIDLTAMWNGDGGATFHFQGG